MKMDLHGLCQVNGIFHGFWKDELFRTTGYAQKLICDYQTTILKVNMGQQVVFIGPVLSNLSIFKVSHTEDKIIQDEIMVVDKGKISRWEIKDIKENSFKWESYISNDRRKTWRMDQEVYAYRKP
jgi:hypothetical protein